MTGVFDKIAEQLDRGLTALGRLCGWLLLLLVAVQLAIVLARYLFAVNFLWLQELALYLHASVFMLAAAWSLTRDKHVRIDIFRGGEAARRRLDRTGTLLMLVPMMGVIGVVSLPYVGQSWSILEGSAEVSGLPGLFLLKSLLPIFTVLMLLAGISRFVRVGRRLA